MVNEMRWSVSDKYRGRKSKRGMTLSCEVCYDIYCGQSHKAIGDNVGGLHEIERYVVRGVGNMVIEDDRLAITPHTGESFTLDIDDGTFQCPLCLIFM